MFLRLSFAIAGAVILLAGCATTTPVSPPPPPLSQTRVENITKLISSGKPLQAIQDITALQRIGKSDISSPELANLLEKAKSKVSELFTKSVSAEDFQRALSLYRSAGQYGTQQFTGWSEGKLLLDLAKSYKNRGMDIPALLTFRKALDAGADVGPAVDEFGKLAVQETDRPILEDIAGWLKKNGKKVPDSYSKLLNETIKPSDVVSGVVTIWVNRGIKVQNGVGVPDRVIGSGFFIDKQGYIITNYHVIESEVNPKYEGYSRLYVMLYNNHNLRIPARVVGYDKVFDIALLKVEVTPPFVLSFSNVDHFQPGDQIFAIGSPGGLENTITSGIISATGRRFQQMGNTLQVDVPVNPGNSGGPLLDSQSRLVGVVFAGIPQFQGINFAIPAHWIEKILPQLYEGGEVTHPWIGAAVDKTDTGLEISYVMPGSPAARVGLQEGDTLVSIDGQKFKDIPAIQDALLNHRPGSLVTIKWTRKGQEHTGLVALGTRPFIPLKTALQRDTRQNLYGVLFGMQVEETGSFLWQKSYRITKIYPGSTADESGLSVGDPITIRGWQVDEQNDVAILQFTVQKKTDGFLQSGVQIGASLKVDNFI